MSRSTTTELWKGNGRPSNMLQLLCMYYTVMVGAGNPVEPKLTGRWVYVHAFGGLSWLHKLSEKALPLRVATFLPSVEDLGQYRA